MDRLSEIRARCEAATPGPWEVYKSGNTVKSHMVHAVNGGCITGGISPKTQNAAFIAASRTLVPKLCDALEAAQKENEELKNILRFNMVQIHGERMTVLDALSSLSARAEKAEAKIKSIHESLNFADKSRSKCANYVELAVSNGLALGKIAVAIQHDYDDEPPKGE